MQIQLINNQNTFGNVTPASKKLIKREVEELKKNHENARAKACMANLHRLEKKANTLYKVTYNGDFILLKSNCEKFADAELCKGLFIDIPLEKLLQRAIIFIDAQVANAKAPKVNIFAKLFKKLKL